MCASFGLAFFVVTASFGHAVASVAPAAPGRVYTTGQAERGLKVYLAQCARCHGEGLRGNESGPALLGAEFLGSWKTKTAADLFDVIRTSMPQDSPGRLTPAETADVVAYILQGNEFPAGEIELQPEPAQLKAVLLDPQREAH